MVYQLYYLCQAKIHRYRYCRNDVTMATAIRTATHTLVWEFRLKCHWLEVASPPPVCCRERGPSTCQITQIDIPLRHVLVYWQNHNLNNSFFQLMTVIKGLSDASWTRPAPVQGVAVQSCLYLSDQWTDRHELLHT